MRKNNLDDICSKFHYPIFPRFSIYNLRSVEDCDFRGYINTYTRGDDEIFRISDLSFSTQKIDKREDLREYIIHLSELSYHSSIRLGKSPLLRIENIFDMKGNLSNRRGLISDLLVADFSFNFIGEILFDELRKICEKGESGREGRTITPTQGLRNDGYRL